MGVHAGSRRSSGIKSLTTGNQFNVVGNDKKERGITGLTGVTVPKSALTEYRLELGSFLCAISVFLTLVGVVGVFFSDELPSYLSALEELAAPFGPWASWLLVVGPLLLVGVGWWLYDYVKKTRSLTRLLATPSKAKFVRNLDEIEYLAWSLPRRYEVQVFEKKKQFNLK
jgi:hypothetical protein